MLVPRVLGDAAEEGEGEGALDVVMPVDRGRDAGGKEVKEGKGERSERGEKRKRIKHLAMILSPILSSLLRA